MARRRRSVPPGLSSALGRSLRRAPWWVVLLVVLGLAFAKLYFGDDAGDAPPVDPAEPDQTHVVERVVDGDTLALAGGERVRMLGVDTPETVHPNRPVEPFGPEASAFTKQAAEGKRVRLAYDKERRDRYGRLLAYVYVGDLFLNEELIRSGFAKAETQYPYRNDMKRRFRDAEDEAKAARRGIWSLPDAGAEPPRKRAA